MKVRECLAEVPSQGVSCKMPLTEWLVVGARTQRIEICGEKTMARDVRPNAFHAAMLVSSVQEAPSFWLKTYLSDLTVIRNVDESTEARVQCVS